MAELIETTFEKAKRIYTEQPADPFNYAVLEWMAEVTKWHNSFEKKLSEIGTIAKSAKRTASQNQFSTG